MLMADNDKSGGIRFVLSNRAILSRSTGYLGLITTEIYFEPHCIDAIEAVFADLRLQGYEIEGIHVPPF